MKWVNSLLDIVDDVKDVYGKEYGYEFLVSVLEFVSTDTLITTGDTKLDLLVNITGLYLFDEKVLEGEK